MNTAFKRFDKAIKIHEATRGCLAHIGTGLVNLVTIVTLQKINRVD
jgi:hypothetical protein